MNVVNVSPEYQSMFTPGSGDSTSMKIIHISEKIAELKMMEPPYRSFTLRKKDWKIDSRLGRTLENIKTAE